MKKIKAYLTREPNPNYTILGGTEVSIKFKYKLPEQGHLDVTLFLSPYWKCKEDYWKDLAKLHPSEIGL